MERQPVTSSAIAAIGHDGEIVEVEFHSGKVYRHGGFSVDDHAKLIGAESIGRHYNEHVKGKFDLLPADEKSPSK